MAKKPSKPKIVASYGDPKKSKRWAWKRIRRSVKEDIAEKRE